MSKAKEGRQHDGESLAKSTCPHATSYSGLPLWHRHRPHQPNKRTLQRGGSGDDLCGAAGGQHRHENQRDQAAHPALARCTQQARERLGEACAEDGPCGKQTAGEERMGWM